jgi:5,10-methylene-tetrahydrofolate dehydrogenase/methenyl tetrahydrofolate cyclohydrolase
MPLYDGLWSAKCQGFSTAQRLPPQSSRKWPRRCALLAARGVRPGLAVVLVGHMAASEIYVRSKVQACADLGIFSELITPPETVTTEEMLELVASLNARDEIDGILIQLPLPAHVDAKSAAGCGRFRERMWTASSQ